MCRIPSRICRFSFIVSNYINVKQEDMYNIVFLSNVFQPFSSHGTFETILSIWRNLDTQNSTNMRILRELRKELAEPRLKNTVLAVMKNLSCKTLFVSKFCFIGWHLPKILYRNFRSGTQFSWWNWFAVWNERNYSGDDTLFFLFAQYYWSNLPCLCRDGQYTYHIVPTWAKSLLTLSIEIWLYTECNYWVKPLCFTLSKGFFSLYTVKINFSLFGT
jgi:hypothetical protein